MKFKELSNMARADRARKLKELELELIKLNAQVATGTPPKNAGQLKRLKKDIAKMKLLESMDKPVLTQKETPQAQIKTTSQSITKSKETVKIITKKETKKQQKNTKKITEKIK